MARRTFFLVVAIACLSACEGCREPPPPIQSARAAPPPAPPAPSRSTAASTPSQTAPQPSAARLPAQELTWIFEDTPYGKLHAVVQLPARRADQRFPVLVALHGRGEALKGSERGARGWVDDYWLPKALGRIAQPPITSQDLLGFADSARLSKLNEALEGQPYEGLIVVCPYTPDVLAGDKPFSAVEPYGKFLIETLLPRVSRETPALAGAEHVGIDGVSLGGRVALLVGLQHAKQFGAVGTLQPAFDSADAPELTRRAEQARKDNPDLGLRLLTSEEDFFLRSTRAISSAWKEAGISHELVVIPGPHDYEFNRGPGVYEMLLFHDRALR